jgi:hypothetical protein
MRVPVGPFSRRYTALSSARSSRTMKSYSDAWTTLPAHTTVLRVPVSVFEVGVGPVLAFPCMRPRSCALSLSNDVQSPASRFPNRAAGLTNTLINKHQSPKSAAGIIILTGNAKIRPPSTPDSADMCPAVSPSSQACGQQGKGPAQHSPGRQPRSQWGMTPTNQRRNATQIAPPRLEDSTCLGLQAYT